MNDSSEVKLHFLDYWRVLRARAGIVTLTFLLVMITAAITTYFVPREYLSTVTIEVKSDDTVLKIFSNQEGLRGSMDPKLAPTQRKILESKEILYPVIEQLDLLKTWGVYQRMTKEEAFKKLHNSMEMTELRNTDMIVIGIYDTDAKLAAQIANTIARVYQEKRRSDLEQILNKGLKQLKDEVDKQRKIVEDAQAEAARIRMEQGIVDLYPESLDNVETTDTRNVQTDEDKANEARIAVATLKTQIQQTETLKPEEMMVALRTLNLDDPTVTKILPLYQDSVVEEARLLNSGLGQKHPKVTALRAQKEVYQKQLLDAVTALRSSLTTKLKINEATLGEIEKKLEQSKDAYQKGKILSKEYLQAKSAYIQAKKVLEGAQLKFSTEGMQKQITIIPAKIWEVAEESRNPARPNVWWYMIFAVFIGLALGIGLAFFIEYLDTSVKTLEDVEKFLGLPVLAVIPKGVGVLHAQKVESPDAESYRILRTNLEFNRKNPDAKSITLLSGGPGEGKSTTILNLAYTCAKGGYNVLIVDADIRRPTQHTMLGIDNSKGLVDYLQGNLTFEQVMQRTSVENLTFIPSGHLPSDSVGILNSQLLADLVVNAKRNFDLVFFDSPPILGVSDGSVLASEVDICIMVIEHRRFPRSMLQRVKQAILNVGGTPLGVVLNKVDTKHDSSYSYYTNYYDYYSPQRSEKPKLKPASAGAGRDVNQHDDY